MQKVLRNAAPTSEGYDVKSPIFLGSKKVFGLAHGMLYIGIERKRVLDMQKSVSVNSFIGSLPRIRSRRIWHVIIDGQIVQGVSAKDNRKATAEAYIASKYPGQAFTLKFHEWRLGAPR
jgi:hypothetical protein